MAAETHRDGTFDPFQNVVSWFNRYKSSLVVVLGILGAWTIYARFFNPRGNRYFPSPTYTVEQTLAFSDRVIAGFQITMAEIAVGFVLSVVVGLLLAIIFAESFILRQMAMPAIVFSYSIPHALMAPLFIVWFGNNLTGIALYVAWSGFFVVFINSLTGLTQVEEEFHQLADVAGATRWQRLRKIKFWAAMPHITTGVKIAVQQSIVGAIIAEFIATGGGLGYLIIFSAELLHGGLLFGVLILLMTLAAILYYGASVIIEIITPGPIGS